MTISKELYLAILSMDSYNRGYGSGIGDGVNVDATGRDLDGLGESGQIGSATVLNPLSVGVSETQYDAWQTAGFYAVAYDTPWGTVISYRGTDNPGLSEDPLQGGSDIINGWIAGAGEATSQTQLAIEFYKSAFGLGDADDAIYAAGLQGGIVTGHSLGGGLAGFLSTLTGTTGMGFDHMPHGMAALAP